MFSSPLLFVLSLIMPNTLINEFQVLIELWRQTWLWFWEAKSTIWYVCVPVDNKLMFSKDCHERKAENKEKAGEPLHPPAPKSSASSPLDWSVYTAET